MLQLVGVADSDAQAEELFSAHLEHFYHKGLHLPPHYIATPGYSDYRSMVNLFSSGMLGGMMACELAALRPERVARLVLIDPIGL